MAQMIVTKTRPAYQAYQLLYLGFIVAPLVAGLDKFTNLLTDWTNYLAPVIADLLPFSGQTFMLLVGLVEIGAAVLVAVRPQIGAYVVAAWLGGIVVNLLLIWPALAVSVKRWHDRDKSGWWVLLNLLPVIGWLWALVDNGFLRGTDGPNRYGPDPLATEPRA